jgi:choline dehydrogenase-like flavoprotein
MADQLSEHALDTTLRVARVMFPHDMLPDSAHAKVVKALAGERGVAALDDPTPFVELDAGAQLAALQAAEGSDYFELVRSTAVVELYDNPLVWKAFGYEGPSAHLGGYVDRGFDDLDWLPDPPIELDARVGSHLALGVPFMAAFVDPGAWGRDFASIMEGYENTAGCWLVGEDMPQESNRVTLNHDELDQHGQPVPDVHFDDHPNDLAMREHAWSAGEALYESVGAVRTIRTPPYPATHNLGTARMSARPQDGVVIAFGQAHDVPNLFVSDGSQFTTGAAANPTLTIVALAIRQAEYIADQLRSQSIPTGRSAWNGRDPGGSVPAPLQGAA